MAFRFTVAGDRWRDPSCLAAGNNYSFQMEWNLSRKVRTALIISIKYQGGIKYKKHAVLFLRWEDREGFVRLQVEQIEISAPMFVTLMLLFVHTFYLVVSY